MKCSMAQIETAYKSLKKVLPKQQIIIAGGAVRDAIHGKDVKDLDVFIRPINSPWDDDPSEANDTVEDAVSSLNKALFHSGFNLSKQRLGSKGYAGNAIRDVWHWESGPLGIPLDLIFVDGDPHDSVAKFDFGICQASFGYYGLRTRREFQRDALNKVITYYHYPNPHLTHQQAVAAREKSQEHAARILAKYPGWKCHNITPATGGVTF